jgi:signal transduction histidine kinase
LAVFLASTGPFIALYLFRQVEARLLQQQAVYQTTLLQTANRMGQIKDVSALAQILVRVLTFSVKAEFASLYILREERCMLAAHRSRRGGQGVPQEIGQSPDLASFLAGSTEPVLTDEIKLRGRDFNDRFLLSVAREMDELGCTVVLPCRAGTRLVGLILLGTRVEGRMFSSRDLTIFGVLAGQTGLAIENALYYERLEKAQERLIESEKMAAIGFLAGGLSHQLKNRFTSLLFFADFAARNVESHRDAVFPGTVCDETLGHLKKITLGIDQSRQVLNGILNYAADRETKTAISLKQLVSSSLEFISFKIMPGSVEFEELIGDDVPPVRGNFAQLQEVMFNIIDNAYQAMMQKKAAERPNSNIEIRNTKQASNDQIPNDQNIRQGFEPSDFGLRAPDLPFVPYQPRLVFTASREGAMVVLTVKDNGPGIKSEDMRKLFTPLFSTKRAGRKGHGLGLYVMKQLIETRHNGQVVYFSKYGEGVRVEIRLPAFSEAGLVA